MIWTVGLINLALVSLAALELASLAALELSAHVNAPQLLPVYTLATHPVLLFESIKASFA